jgi:hypothetical protein
MKIPAFWAKATANDADRAVSISCWRSSDQSEEEARQSALTAAANALQRIFAAKSKRYPYGDMPLREEVIERFTGPQDELAAAVTRNAYGSLVLNAANVMFVDIDFPPVSAGEQIKYFFARLFNRSTQSPEVRQEKDTLRRLQEFVGKYPHWGFRVYRTRAGLRAMATHDLFDPAADTTLDVLRMLGSDPLYVRLCKAQECFRARLTPKPWRCGHAQNTTTWPRESEEQQRQFDDWLAAYKSHQAHYATCRFLTALGSGAIHPEIATILEIHDKITRCDEPCHLA